VKLLTLADGDKLLNIARIVETEEETAVPFEAPKAPAAPT
jgi:hypothetical protein